MNLLIVYLYKGSRRLRNLFTAPLDKLITYWVLKGNNVEFRKFNSRGVPLVQVTLGGKFSLGRNFTMNNRAIANPIGRTQKCSFSVGRKGVLLIGDHVGMSSSSIVCRERVQIGDNVKIGGNVVIYDTDFHSLNPEERKNNDIDIEVAKSQAVNIGNNVFIGAHSTILKGVSIGENSIIGACSVVTKSIPANEIWAGNPAKKIKAI